MALVLVPIVVMAVAAVILLSVVRSCMYIVPPNQLLVLSGRTHRRPDGAVVGYRVVHGSDPLPFAGEERRFGCYASRIDNLPPSESADQLMRKLPGNSGVQITPCGRRSGPLELLQRLRENAASRKSA